MVDNTVVLYKQILDASYNIYVDINNINSAMSRANSIMGLPAGEALTLLPRTGSATKQNGSFIPSNPVVQGTTTKEGGAAKSILGYHPIGRERDIPIEMQPLAAGLKVKKASEPVLPTSMHPVGEQKLPEVEMQKIAPVIQRRNTETLAQKEERVGQMAKIPLGGPKIPTQMASANMESIQSLGLERSAANPVSALLSLVKIKGSITISDAAAQLNVNRTLVEKWAKILNQSSLLRIKYQMVGDIIMEA